MYFKIFIWAVLYNAVFILSEYSRVEWLVSAMVFVYSILFIIWLFRKKQNKNAGLRFENIDLKTFVKTAPLYIQAVFNVVLFDNNNILWYNIFLVIGAVIVEEIFFRGIIQHWLIQKNIMAAIILTNILFAFYHIANIAAGAEAGYVALQMAVAFAAGICYSMTTVIHKSILPCMLAHFATNITGTAYFVGNSKLTLYAVAVTAFYISYAVYLFLTNKNLFEHKK